MLQIHFHPSVALPLELQDLPLGALADLLREEDVADEGNVHCILTSDAEMASLNERFRGNAEPTDVLAFPYDPAATNGVLGDIYVSLGRARAQAVERGEPLEREVWRLFVHGALHLAGRDHDTEARDRAMQERQEAWVERIYPAGKH